MNGSWDQIVSRTVRAFVYLVLIVFFGFLLGNTQRSWAAACVIGALVVASYEITEYYKRRRSFAERQSIPSLGQRVIVGVLRDRVDDYFASEYLADNPRGIQSRRKAYGLEGRVVGLLEDHALADGVVVLMTFPLAGSEARKLPFALDELKEA